MGILSSWSRGLRPELFHSAIAREFGAIGIAPPETPLGIVDEVFFTHRRDRFTKGCKHLDLSGKFGGKEFG